MLPQCRDGHPVQRHHHDPRAMAWEIFVTSDSRRRGAGRRLIADEEAAPEPIVRRRRFWEGLQSLVGRVRNLV